MAFSLVAMDFPHIIDNSAPERSLDFTLNKFIVPHFSSLKIAVAYFYVSGFEMIADELQKHIANTGSQKQPLPRIQAIISPHTDRPTSRLLLTGSMMTAERQIKEVLQAIEADLGSCKHETAELFLELMTRNQLDVRICTSNFFHAKVYLARTSGANSITHLYSIVGSSNFTRQGLTQNNELSIGQEGKLYYGELQTWFDTFWQKNTEDIKEELFSLLKQNIAHKKKYQDLYLVCCQPYQMFLLLIQYFLDNILGKELDRPRDVLAEFQRVGAQNLLSKLERLGGALLCDSVGLGKTFTVAEVIRRYYEKGENILVVIPPKLILQWKETLEEDFQLEVNGRLQFISHGKLKQNAREWRSVISGKKQLGLLVIDEAHNARNHHTNFYRNLTTLINQAAKRPHVLLLSATPFNNSLRDLKNLSQLCVTDTRLLNAGFTPKSFDILLSRLNDLKKKKKLSEIESEADYQPNFDKVQNILNEVMLLRMRSTLKTRYKNIEIGGKPLIFYDPKVYKEKYVYPEGSVKLFAALGDFLEKLHLPHILLSNPNLESGRALAGLFLILLFKRIESSLYAFYCSLQNILQKEKELLAALDQGNDLEEIIKEYNQYKKETHIQPVDEGEELFSQSKDDLAGAEQAQYRRTIKPSDVRRWINEDTARIEAFIEQRLAPLCKDKDNALSIVDPKIDCFIKKLKSERFVKCLVFTGFKDTAYYLEACLREAVAKGSLDLRFAATYSNDHKLRETLERFAPMGQGLAGQIADEKQLDLLITTDVLSEGANLQDANLLINFDLPWNPMRIVQRVGRINRIGSSNQVRVINLVPDESFGNFLPLLEKLAAKIKQVGVLVGKEMAILSSEEEELSIKEIGVEYQRMQEAGQLSQFERPNAMLAKVQGETPDDFFRNALYRSALDNKVRKSDFAEFKASMGDSRQAAYYTITSKNPQQLYRFYEIYGRRQNESKDRIFSQHWCMIDGAELKAREETPSDFLSLDFGRQEGYRRSHFVKPQQVEEMERRLDAFFAKILAERKELNKVSNLGARSKELTGVQAKLLRLLEQLLSKDGSLLHDTSFRRIAGGLGIEGQLDDMHRVLKIHDLRSALRFRVLQEDFRNMAFELGSVPHPKLHRPLAEALGKFYKQEIEKDASLSEKLYRADEIHWRLRFAIYMDG